MGALLNLEVSCCAIIPSQGEVQMNESGPGREITVVDDGLRERTVASLSRHFAQDRLSIEEFERRTTAAYAARTPAELEHLLSDLLDPPDRSAVESTREEIVRGSARRRDLVFNILGGSERRGRWTPAPRMLAITVAGGVLLDFRDVSFATNEVAVTALALLGGETEILVPRNVRVELTGVPFLGRLRDDQDAVVDPGAPLLRIRGYTVLGTVRVRRLPPGEPYEPDW
jgi:hypothetical protein